VAAGSRDRRRHAEAEAGRREKGAEAAIRNRVEAVVLGLLFLGIAAVLAWPQWPQPDRVTLENFDRINDGMSRTEVEAILGPQGTTRVGRSLSVFLL
jgi:hypothetical protein